MRWPQRDFLASTESMDMILSIDNVTVTYPDGDTTVTALDHASLHAEAGRIRAVVGESGSGKSTLLSVAAGLRTPDSGTVRVVGLEPSESVRRGHIGLVFQSANMIPALTVREQLLITDHIRGISPRKGRADELLERVGLADKGDRPIRALSGGQQQRVGIARALMGSPELLLADEPTSALDQDNSRAVMALLRDVTRETKVACLFVTHDRGLLEFVDDVTEVVDGRVLDRVVGDPGGC